MPNQTSLPDSSLPNTALSAALAALFLGWTGLAAQAEAPDPTADLTIPHFFAKPGVELARPHWHSFVNSDGSPRIHAESDYQRFLDEVAPKLESWATDPRLDINPALVAALMTKESGFQPFATSWVPASGYPQLTHIADADMLQIAREAPEWSWMLEELEQWPRHPIVHRADASKEVTDSLVAAGELHGANEYFFHPMTATRGAVFWLRILAEVWLEDEFPGRYGSFASERLSGGGPLNELQLIDLVLVSYNQGYPYVRDLVERHGNDWTMYVNNEAADYLERVKAYTVLYQK